MRKTIVTLIKEISPYDQMEKTHIRETIDWIKSGSPLFRIKKPDTPPQHLVSYFVVIDEQTNKILLVNHKKAKLLLPPGGHVEYNEHPKKTAEREIREELFMPAEFINKKPFFITVTKTINTDAGHIDVSLWFLVKGDSTKKLHYDTNEFDGYTWFSPEELLTMNSDLFDPHMHRFIKKLQRYYLQKE